MNNTFWRPSDEQRRTILLMEVAGLLHDLGKLSNGFIKEQSKDELADFYYNYQLITDPLEIICSADEVALKKINDIEKITNKIKKQQNSDQLDEIKLQAALEATRKSAIFNIKKDITQTMKSQDFDGWDNNFYNLAEILLGQFASEELANFTGRSFQPAILIRQLQKL